MPWEKRGNCCRSCGAGLAEIWYDAISRARIRGLTGFRKFEQRPSSGRVSRHLQPRAAFAAASFGIDKSAQVFKSVGGDKPGGRQFPESVFDLTGQQARGASQLWKK